MITVGERIKLLRKHKNLTQEELGDLVGVKKAAIQKYESNSIVNLKIDTIEKLCKIFEVSPNFLLGWQTTNLLPGESEKRDMFVAILKEHFGNEAKELLTSYYFLNDNARVKFIEYGKDLTKIKEYERERLSSRTPTDTEQSLN